MSGSLYQLVSMDNNNRDMFNLTKKATENRLYTFNELNAFTESRRLRLNRDSDTIIPQYLIFNLNSNISSNDFINGLEMSNFKLLIGGNTIVDTLLSLYANLNPIKNIRNNSNSCSIIITIPFNITFDSINMLKLLKYGLKLIQKIVFYLSLMRKLVLAIMMCGQIGIVYANTNFR